MNIGQAVSKLADDGMDMPSDLEAGFAAAGPSLVSAASQGAANRSEVTVLHVVEALLGGPASYMREILPEQEAHLGRQRIGLIIPRDQRSQLPGHESYKTGYFTSRRPRFLNVLRLMAAIRKWLWQHDVDVIHAQGTFAGIAVRLALRGMSRRPKVVYCSHGWAFDRRTSAWKNHVAAAIERFLAGWADSIVCISDHEYRSALRVGIRQDRLFKIVTGINSLPPRPATPEVAWPEGKRRFLFVGRFDHQKGLELYLQAMQALGANAHGYAIGQSAVKNPPRLEFPENVSRTGWLSRDMVQSYMESAEVLVMPSHWEGFGLTAIEAMRAGKAVIATRVGGLAEIVQEGVSGLLIEPGDLNGLITAMASLTDDDVKRMGQAGRARFLEHYQADRMNRSLLSLYRLMKLG